MKYPKVSNHSSDNIYRMIRGIIEEYGLTSKFFFSTLFDNASTNTTSIRPLQEYLRPSCRDKYFILACHVLNLCVQTRLESLKQFVRLIRDVISQITRKMTLVKQWTHYCSANNVSAKKFPKDVKTRWNYAYQLFNATFPCKALLTTFINNALFGFNIFFFNINAILLLELWIYLVCLIHV